MSVKYTIPFKDFNNQQWRIDVANTITGNGDPVFNFNVDDSILPIVKAGYTLNDLTDNLYIGGGVDNGSFTVLQGHNYQIRAAMNNAPANPNPRMRLTIYENGTLIFDKSVPAPNPGAEIIKEGLAIPGYIYDIFIVGDYNAVQVTPVDDESDPSGIPVPVRGNGQAGVLVWQPDNTDDPFACYKSSTLTVNCIQEGQINIAELQQAQDRDFTIKVYRDNVLYWQGFLVPDGIQYSYQATPFNFTFTAICGLTLLENIPYIHTDLEGTTAAISRCPMNYIRNILFTLLGNTAPIRWTNLLTNFAFDLEDVFIGSVQWGSDGQAFLTYTGSSNDGDESIAQTCDYILKGILQSMQCCIYFDNGRWNIRRIPDIVRTIIPYKQIAGDLNVMVVQAATENLTKQIGRSGFNFINEDQIITVKQGIKTCQTTYAANVRNNILPNGTQDLQNPSPQDGPLYWDIWDATNIFAVSSVGSLDGRDGYASDLIFQGVISDPDEYFTMFNGPSFPVGKRGLPIDTAVMIPYIIFGFQFEIVAGFPFSSGTVIDWAGDPLRIKVIYNTNGQQYFLNAYGFWTLTDTYIAISVAGLSVNDVAQIDFNAFQNVPIPTPAGTIVAGFENNLQVLFRIADGQFYKVDNIYVNIQSGNDVYESTFAGSKNTTVDKRTLNISSSFGGYMLSNFMTSPFNSGDECYFIDEGAYQGSLTGLTANAIMRCCYKSSRIFNGSINTGSRNWSFDGLYNIDGFAGAYFLSLGASYNIEQCQVNNLVAIEIRNDNVTFTEKYYNSNTVNQ